MILPNRKIYREVLLQENFNTIKYLEVINNPTLKDKWDYFVNNNLTDELQNLINSGFNKNTFDEEGNNILMTAINKRSQVLFDFAMKNKVSIYQKNIESSNALSHSCYPQCPTHFFIQIWKLIKPHNVDNIISGLTYDFSLDIYDTSRKDLKIGMCFHRLLRDKTNFDKIKWLIPRTSEDYMKENISSWISWAQKCGFIEVIPYINRSVLTFEKLTKRYNNKDFSKKRIIKI